jgi:AcrR family transcriptional regulator
MRLLYAIAMLKGSRRPVTRTSRPAAAAAARPQRSDGLVTRDQILETAGQVFAERGYARTTSKEICERAQASQAAVNYHFGSKDGLYEAVLIEAHRQILDTEDLTAWANGPGDARERLARVLRHVIGLVTQPASWGFAVMLREIMSPSPMLPALAVKAIKPKANVLMNLVAEITGLPAGSATLQRCVFFSIVPCMLMAVAPPAFKSNLVPLVEKDANALADDLLRFVLGGLEAMTREAKRSRAR